MRPWAPQQDSWGGGPPLLHRASLVSSQGTNPLDNLVIFSSHTKQQPELHVDFFYKSAEPQCLGKTKETLLQDKGFTFGPGRAAANASENHPLQTSERAVTAMPRPLERLPLAGSDVGGAWLTPVGQMRSQVQEHHGHGLVHLGSPACWSARVITTTATIILPCRALTDCVLAACHIWSCVWSS